jgi:tryptophan synthase alpha chain
VSAPQGAAAERFGATRLADAFAGSGKRAALMPYLMGGFPSLESSLRIGHACLDAGADVLEVGVPFSDPLADGPVIHAAGVTALKRGATLDGVLEVVGDLARRAPVVVMCYANPVFARGATQFVARLGELGASGLIVPDLPAEESEELLAATDEAGVALVPLVAPTTPDDRLATIGARARGFIYCVAVTGTTGERIDGEGYGELLARVKAHSPVPVALGFGISTPEQAALAADSGAAGVIVGSRLVRAAAEADDPAAAVGALVGELAGALSDR